MKAPLSWIREFTPAAAPPEELAHRLSSLGLVVEGVDRTGPCLPGIVVARVLATRRHPAADRIQLVEVDAGDGEGVQVCCGAFNMKAGDLVPLATVGTVMPSGLEIARRKMRGEWSNGMLCSAPEIGAGAEGPVPAIYVFPGGSAEPGQPAAAALGWVDDVVFDLEVSPNRPDCFSIAGVARDLAAALGDPFGLPAVPRSVDTTVPAARAYVNPDAAGLCRRFTATVIEDADQAAVPAVVAYRLRLAGMRPINPVVDASNYVMLELGQPNHPYDLGALGGGGLAVRRAGEGEELVTLDGTHRRLQGDDLVIADATGQPVGIAGIMGGASAEIGPGTKTVLLEVANFDPGHVSATGQRLGLHSEARTRFERGVDVEVADRATDRFAQLLGPIPRRGETTDIRTVASGPVRVALRAARANLLLGTSLRPEECAGLIAPLGFRSEPSGEESFVVTVPTWRPDCSREADLIEEIARIYGYDRIARALPARPMAATGLTAYQRGRRRVREVMTGAGASEAWTPTFVSPEELAAAALDPTAALELENPLDQSQSRLRTSLLPGLLRAARFNVERQAGALALFEIGSVFRRPGRGGPGALVAGVDELEELGWLCTGPGADANLAARAWDVLSRALGLAGAEVGPGDLGAGPSLETTAPPSALPPTPEPAVAWAALHPGRRAEAVLGGRRLAVFGELAPDVAARHNLPGRVAVVLADLAGLLDPLNPLNPFNPPAVALADPSNSPPPIARPVSRFPASDLDMAFVVPEAVPAGKVAATVRQAGGGLVEEVALFDVWRDISLGEGRRSLAFRARLRAADHTLTEREVGDVRDRVEAEVLGRHGGVLRRA